MREKAVAPRFQKSLLAKNVQNTKTGTATENM